MNRAAPIRMAAALAVLVSAVAASAQTLLIGNKGEDTVSFVDLATGRQCDRVATGKAPHEIAVSPDGRRAAVVAYGGTTIEIFDVRKARLIRRLDLTPNAGPHGIVWLTPNQIVVVADRSNSLVSIDLRSGTVRSVGTGQRGSHMLAVAPDRRRAYIANILDGTVTIVDLNRMEKLGDIAVGGNPEGLAITPDGRELWVGDNSKPQVRIVDLATKTIVATLPTDSIALRLAISPGGSTAVSSNFLTGTLNLFDVAKRQPLRTIRVSGDRKVAQVTIVFAQKGKRLLVAETGQDTIAEVELSSGTVLRRIVAGKNGDGLGVASARCAIPVPGPTR